MDKDFTEQEKRDFINKVFDCEEATIKEWLAEYIGVPVEKVFNDFEDTNDVIGFQHENKQYNAFVVTMSSDTNSLVDKVLLDKSEKAAKACSMLFDGVFQVFSSVIMTALPEYNEKVRSVIPRFDENKMAFHLWAINKKAAELQLAKDQYNKLQEFITNKKTELTDEQKTAIESAFSTINNVFKTNTVELLDKDEAVCKQINETIRDKSWLHIVIEEFDNNDHSQVSESIKRLPVLGKAYQDPEENYIDKLKKEYDIME